MTRYFVFLTLLAMSIVSAACGAAGSADRSVSTKDSGACIAHADVTEVEDVARGRLALKAQRPRRAGSSMARLNSSSFIAPIYS